MVDPAEMTDEQLIEHKRQQRRAKKLLLEQQAKVASASSRSLNRAILPLSSSNSSAPRRKFTLMTYNILAQCLIRRNMYPTSGNNLRWKARRPLLLKEFEHYRPDILCLQEVDQWEDVYAHELRALGYEAVYSRGAKKLHGCCIAWRQELFEKRDEKALHYDDLTTEIPKTRNTGNIAQLVALRFRSEKASLGKTDKETFGREAGEEGVIVGTTHLYWRPGTHYERLRQATLLLEGAMDFGRDMSYPIFLCGDFNMSPADPAYWSLTKAPLQPQHLAMLNESRHVLPPSSSDSEDDDEGLDEAEDAEADHILNDNAHQAQLDASLMTVPDLLERVAALPRCNSAYNQYSSVDGSRSSALGEPIHSVYTHFFKALLDYIFVVEPQQGKPEDEWRATALLKMPEEEELQPALPNEEFASDHISMMAEFGLFTKE
ncbi:uncharacterized protein VTP21DRAFT_6625 [Calcarisporiella thermophila]|uniref:uncharacterized protein n=1 Tax=Calcarisporiella thermophila TaxID=911321 RepID=UPI003742169E